MKTQYKALVLDLDGTTVPNRLDGMPSQRVLEAISQARKKIHVCVASGRTIWQATPVLNVLKLSDPVILVNGALIIDGVSRKPIYEQPLRKEDYFTLIELVKDRGVRFTVDQDGRTVEYNPDYQPEKPLGVFVWDQTEEDAHSLMREISHMPAVVAHKVVGWKVGTVGVSIHHQYATKLHAILEVSKILGVEREDIIGIGDGPNDFPLLMACGLKVAMGNAVSDLQAIADYIAPTVDEDGVADVIEKFILNSQ